MSLFGNENNDKGVEDSASDEEDDSFGHSFEELDLRSDTVAAITVQVTFKGRFIPQSKINQIVSSHPSIARAKDGRLYQDSA